MKKTLILAAVAASLTAPAFAESATATAVSHFNQDIDSANELRQVPEGDSFVTVATRNGSALDYALQIFNSDEDSLSGQRGLTGATVYTASSDNDVFDRIRAESLENE